MQAAVVPKDQTTWPVVFEARADAPIAGKLADLALRTPADAKVQIKGGVWQNYDLVQDGNNGTYYQTWTDKIAVAVVDELPFKISVEPIKAPLVQSGSLDVKIIAERKAGFDEPIKVINLYNPPGTGSTPDITIPKGEKSATYQLNANGGATVKNWKIAFLGSATVDGGTAYASTQLADLEVQRAALRVQAGESRQTDLLRAQVDQSRAERELNESRNDVVLAARELFRLLALLGGFQRDRHQAGEGIARVAERDALRARAIGDGGADAVERDGLPGDCLLLFSPGDIAKQTHFLDEITDEHEREVARAQLRQIVHYAESAACRRAELLEYFGEKFPSATPAASSDNSKPPTPNSEPPPPGGCGATKRIGLLG